MTKFFYQARRGPDKLEEGTIEAESESQAVNKLTQMGYYPISVTSEAKALKERPQRVGLFQKITNRDLTIFTRQLSNLLESGLTLYRALTVLHQQTENKYLKLKE